METLTGVKKSYRKVVKPSNLTYTITGTSIAKLWLRLHFMDSLRLAWYCGKIYMQRPSLFLEAIAEPRDDWERVWLVFRLFEKLGYSNERSTKFESLNEE